MTLAGTSTAKAGVRALKPGEKYNVAMIGCGHQMRGTLLPSFLGHHGCKRSRELVRVVAVCDCDKARLADAVKRVNDTYKDNACRSYADFREVINDQTIDAVCIATPDHWHAYLCVEAMKHGKDVYCEKPLTWSIDEAKKVMEAQKKYDRVFQTGTMQRSYREFRDAVALVRGGLIGEVKFVDANFGGASGKHGGTSHPVRFFDNPENAAKEGAPNPDVDWNMWLGPAAWRPYSDQLAPRGVHHFFPMFWRMDDDCATGMNGDWGAHHLDIAQWGLDMDQSGPYKVIRSEQPYSKDLFHGGRRQWGAKLIFKKPYGDVELFQGPFSTWGTVFYGTKGIVAVNRGKIAVWKWDDPATFAAPTAEIRQQVADGKYLQDKRFTSTVGPGSENLGKALDKIEKSFADVFAKANVYNSGNQIVNFCECIQSRKPTISTAETGGRGSILCQLCNLSYKYDTGFDWDPVKMDFADGNAKRILLKRANSRGWDIVV